MRLSRGGQVVALFAGVLVAVLGQQVPRCVEDLDGPSFPDALLALGSLIAVALAGWVLLIAALSMLGVSSRVLARVTPSVLRGVLLAGAAGVLVAGPTHAAHAAQAAGPEARHIPHSVSGLPLPDRPESQVSPARAPAPHTVRVRPGDTLWAIAARSLPKGATDAQIAAATRAWHQANRDVIGADPHLIFPAQILTPPTGKDLP